MANNFDKLGFIPDFVPEDGERKPASFEEMGFEPDDGIKKAKEQVQESKLLEAAKAGVQRQVIPAAVSALKNIGVTAETIKKLPVKVRLPLQAAFKTSQALKPKKDFVPTTTAEKAVAEVTSFLDPSTLALGGTAFKLAGRAIKASKLGIKADKLQKIAKVAQRAEALGVDKAAIKEVTGNINRRILLNRFAQTGVKSAAAGGVEELARGTAQQIAEGEFRPKELLTRTTVGIVGGGLLGPVGEVAIRGGAQAVGALGRRVIPLADKPVDALLVDTAAKRAKQKASELVSRKVIKEESKDTIAQKLFLDELETKGIRQSAEDVLPGKTVGQFLNKIELSDAVDRKLGTLLTDTTEKMIQGEFQSSSIQANLLNQFGKNIRNLEKLGVGRKTITRMLMHMETLPDGTIAFNPEARQITSKFARDAFDGPAPNQAVLNELTEIRRSFNSVFQDNPMFAEKAGFIDGYVPLIRKRKGLTAKEIKAGSTRNVEEAFFLKERLAPKFNEAMHEADFSKLARFYARAASRHIAFNKHLPRVYAELTKLRWLGREQEAQVFGKQFARSMGIRNAIDIRKMFGADVARANRELIQDIAQDTVSPRKFVEELTDVMKSSTFDSLVFMNPRTIIKQAIQPELVGSGEIGLRWMAKGRALDLTKDGKKLAENMMEFMRSKRAEDFAELQFNDIENKFLKAIKKTTATFAGPGKYTFNKLDIRNRRVAFLGARAQFMEEAGRNLEAMLDGLLSGEKSTIRKILRDQGAEAAANMYGILRSRRINYAYGLADSPEFFAKGIGRHIPFTTWSRNQMNRVIGDVRNRNIKKLAARAAKPFAILTGIKLLTGYEIPGAHPLLAATGALSARPFPAISETATTVQMRGFGPAALQELSNFTPIGPIRRFKRDIDKAKDIPESILRLRKEKEDSFTHRFRKEILRNFSR